MSDDVSVELGKQGGLINKSVLEVHTMLRQALEDARRRGSVTRNVLARATL